MAMFRIGCDLHPVNRIQPRGMETWIWAMKIETGYAKSVLHAGTVHSVVSGYSGQLAGKTGDL
jgi:hypothetical protein